MKRQVGNSIDRGNIGIEREGTYHLLVDKIDEEPTNKQGNLIDGFRVHTTVLNGTAQVKGSCPEKDKKHQIMFYNPDMSKPQSSQDFATSKQDRFLSVIGLITEEDLGKEVDIDCSLASGRQFVAKFRMGDDFTKTDGTVLKGRIELAFKDMWHVDDPQVADVPKDEACLKLIPAELRLTADQKSKAAETAKAAKKTEYSEPSDTKPADAPVSLDSI